MEQSRKHSHKRDAILACLRGTTSHPSAEWIYSQLKPAIPGLSLATVYRNLSLFKANGLICSVGVVNGLERFDGNIQPHAHFICRRCGCVQDLPELPIPHALCREAEAAAGCDVEECTLRFTGLCRICRDIPVGNAG